MLYENANTPKSSGTWKSGFARFTRAQVSQCGCDDASAHLKKFARHDTPGTGAATEQ